MFFLLEMMFPRPIDQWANIYARMVDVADAVYVHNGNAETYMLVGDALGKGMVKLLEGRK